VDGDGDLDAFTDQGFYRNDGDAADALWSQAITPEGMAWNGGLPVLADLLDADGRPDTLFGVRGGVHLYRNLGDLPPQVASTAPAEHGLRAGAVVATFDNIMDPSTVISSNVSVVGSVSGAVAGSLFYEPTSQQLIYLPEGKFAEGETVEVTLKAAITDAAGNGLDGDGDGIAEGSPADDYTWSFTIKERSHLVISAEFEPETLYLYDAESSGQLVLQAIYQGPIGNRSYGYQPVILRKLPGIADGDAVINPVTVNTGDQVVDTHNDVVTLTVGTEVRPAGCRSTGCAVVFDGTPLQMDQLAATFELLPDLQWSDGEPLTADDSVYSYEIHRAEPYLNPPMFEFPPDALARTASYVALDELRTRWTALPGYIDSRFNLVFWHPLPRHAWEGQGLTPADLHTAPESTQSPLGWGPYSVEAWEPGVAITLTANPYYAGYPELPKIDTLVFRFADDSADALARVLAGEADATWSIGGLPDKLLALDGYGALNAHVVAGTVWEHGDFAIDVVAGYSRPDYFEDRALRQAVAHCLDREAMADAVTAGYGQVLHTYIPAEHPLYPGDEKLTLYPHTVLSGTQLLEGLGWTDTDGDGIRECNGCTTAGAAEGEKLTFKWQSSDAPLRITYMQIAQANLSACGIDLQIQALPITELFANGPEGPLFGRHFDIGSFAWISDYEPSCDLYTSDQIPSTANGWSGLNISGFSNAAYDTACTTALTSLPGTAAYVNNHYEAMRILSEEAPIVPLFSRIETAAAHPRLTGLRLDPTSRTPLDNVETWEFLVDGLSPQGTVRIGDGSPVQVERSTTLHLTAQDLGGGSVSQMLLRERAWIGQQWRVVAETGWIPFTASYAWELDPTPGAHYVSAYFMDDSGNASSLPARAFVNLTPGNSGIARGEAAVYRMTMRAGETLTATLSTLSGDADLYLWAHGNEGSPDAYSDLDGTREDQIVITGTVAGDYHVEVRGYAEESTYALAFDTASGAATRVSTEAASLALAKSVPSEPATTDAPDDTPAEAPGGLPAAAEVRAPLLTLDAGGESVQLTAELWDQKGENVADGTVVTFTTSLGSFGISGSDASTATTASGLVRVTLRSGTETGAAQVTARAGEAAASLTINFRWPYTIYLPLTLRP
jgi:peptide/nickel transport system substrate-binding protein